MRKKAVLLTKSILIILLVMFFTGCIVIPAPTSTPTPTPEPTPEPAPEPEPKPEQASGASAPRTLFSDDFSNEISGWDTFEDETGAAYYKYGWLHIKNYTYAEFDTSSYNFSAGEFDDFILEVETKLVDGTNDNWHSALCRVQETDDPRCYILGISADGFYSIGKFQNWEIIELTPPTRSIYILKGEDAVNLIRVECIGDNLRLSVNGHLLAEVSDSTYDSGCLGLAATAWVEQHGKQFSEIAFDNLVVTEP